MATTPELEIGPGLSLVLAEGAYEMCLSELSVSLQVIERLRHTC